MVDYQKLFETVIVVIAAFAAVGGGLGGLYAAARSRRVTALKGDLGDCNARHDTAEQELAVIRERLDALQNELNAIRDIPLKAISEHMEKTNQILAKLEDKIS